MQVSLLGRDHSQRLGSLENFLRVGSAFIVLCLFAIGPSSAAAQELDPSEAMEIYRTVDGWTRDWEVNEQHIEALPAVAVASITLRLDGQIIGREQIMRDDADAQSIALAARGAMAKARAWVRTKTGDEPSEEQWSAIGSRLTLSVELAQQTVPMRDTELGLPSLGLSPGVQGLVMRMGQQTEIMTPDEMIALGFTVEQAAYAMATALSDDGAMALASIGELIERGYTFSRFNPIWIAQQDAGKGGVFLDRGGRMIEDSSVGTKSVRNMGERIARYLIAQQWPGSERFGMVGTRDVVSGRASPEVAPVYEQALVAHALLQFARQSDKPIHARAREVALRLLDDLGTVQPGEPVPWDDGIGSAACVIALSHEFEGFHTPEWIQLEIECREKLAGLYSPIGGFASEILEGARGFVAWALVRAKDKNADHAVRTVFRDTQPGQLVGQMPFLGWAELELASGSDQVPAASALTQMRSRLWDHQISKSDLDWRDRDYAGAVVFTTGSSSLPTSGNLRPIAMACTMLGDERLTPGTIADGAVASEIGRVASAMRFVDQLVMSDASGFVSRAPERCIGGVRESLWEWNVSPASSAIALLAALEFERSVNAIAARPIPDQTP
jgi:hypothetical protein